MKTLKKERGSCCAMSRSSSPPTTAMPSSSPSSSASASATREKKVYIRIDTWPAADDKFTGTDECTYEWYAIDDDDNNLDDSEEVVETLKPVFQSPPDSSHYLCGFAAWKSYLYIFGGRTVPKCTRVSNAHYIDTRRPYDGWKVGPNLIHARDFLHGVVFKGRIYALGGCPELPMYGESLLPLSNNNNQQQWLPLHMTRKEPFSAPRFIHGHAIFGKKLFVYGCYPLGLRSYDFNRKKWSLIVKDFGYWQYQCASIDQVMYLVEGWKFMGFDLVKHQWYKVVGLQVDTMLPPYADEYNRAGVPSSLVHIGNGTLCLLWICHTDIHCTKFTVCKEEDDNGCPIIKATVKSFKIFRLLNGGSLAGALAIDTGEDSDHDKVEDEEKESVKDQGKSVTIAKKENVKDQAESVIIAKKEDVVGSAKGERELPKKKKKKKKDNKKRSLPKKELCCFADKTNLMKGMPSAKV